MAVQDLQASRRGRDSLKVPGVWEQETWPFRASTALLLPLTWHSTSSHLHQSGPAKAVPLEKFLNEGDDGWGDSLPDALGPDYPRSLQDLFRHLYWA